MNPLSQRTKTVSSPLADMLRGACYFFFTLGIIALGYVGFVSAGSHVYQTLEMKKFNQANPLAEPHILAEGEVIGEIEVPRLGLNAIVVQGDSPASLTRAVGHLSDSALPGEWGNVALAGHRDTFFRPLRDIRLGDGIRFKTRERTFDYRVESIEVVAPTDIRVLESSTGHDLTLLTCYPIYYIGPAPNRLVVRAREIQGIGSRQLASKNKAVAVAPRPAVPLELGGRRRTGKANLHAIIFPAFLQAPWEIVKSVLKGTDSLPGHT